MARRLLYLDGFTVSREASRILQSSNTFHPQRANEKVKEMACGGLLQLGQRHGQSNVTGWPQGLRTSETSLAASHLHGAWLWRTRANRNQRGADGPTIDYG